jgi:hypothetical protein
MSGQRQHPEFLRPADAGRLLGLSAKVLANWRWKGCGPPFHRFSRRAVRYRLDQLLEWAEQSRRESTSDPGPAAAGQVGP